MADFLQMAREECTFWRELVERGICIRKNDSGFYRVYDSNNTPFYGTPNTKDLPETIQWVKENVLEQAKETEVVSFLLTAMYNKGFGPEFIDCAIIKAANPQTAQAAAYAIAVTYFKKYIPKYEPDDVRIRPVAPGEKYDKLEKVTI